MAGHNLGKNTDGNEILVEGGSITSISEWISQRAPELPTPRESIEDQEEDEKQQPQQNGDEPGTVEMRRASSSGLSSVGDRLGDDGIEDMDLT